MKIAIITGASSGIGYEFVKQLEKSKSIDEIWVIARRKERLVKIKESSSRNIKVLCTDIMEDAGLWNIKNELSQNKPEIMYLINSAGYGIRKDFAKGSYEEMLGMINLNCSALTAITHMCIPYMKKGSKIIQVASSAGFLAQAGFGVYSATKSYVISFSKALNIELKPQGISVTAVCPGPVETEFFNISDKGSKVPSYKKIFMAKPEHIVRRALIDANKDKKLSVYGFSIKLMRFGAKFLS